MGDSGKICHHSSCKSTLGGDRVTSPLWVGIRFTRHIHSQQQPFIYSITIRQRNTLVSVAAPDERKIPEQGGTYTDLKPECNDV